MPERVLTDTPIDEVQSTTFSLCATLVLYAPTRPALARTAKQHARRRAVMEPLDRIELSTCSLRVSRSTD